MARARYVLLLFFVTQISQMTQIFLRGIIFVPQIYTDIHRFFSSEGFSSDFTDESEGILAYRITHGFSQIFGRWPMAGARYVLLCFWSRRFRRWRRFFFVWLFLSHRFHRYTQIFLNLRWIALSDLRGYLQRPNRSPPRNSVSNRRNKKSPNKFRVIRWWKNLRHLRNLRDLKNVPRKICVYLWNLWDFLQPQGVSFLRGIIFVPQISQIYTDFLWISGESLCPISGGICNDRTGRLCEIPCHPMTKKICVICEICVTKNPTQIFLFVYNSVLFDLIY